jgi:plasmid stabilization system protein ParE
VRLRVRLSEPASEELTEAVRWYESRRPGLGAELLEAVTATLELIDGQPEIGAAAYADPETRRALIQRFPYQVVYRPEQHGVVVIALAHLKRRPGYWKHRADL